MAWFLAAALVMALLMLGLLMVSELVGRAHGAKAAETGPGDEGRAEKPEPTRQTAAHVPDALRSRFGVTQREQEVLELVLTGYTARDISARLVVSENTVKTHLRRAYAKMGVHSRAEARALIEELSGR